MIAGLILAVVGSGLCAAAAKMGAPLPTRSDWNRSWRTSSHDVLEHHDGRSLPYNEDISHLKVDLPIGDLTLLEGDSFSYELSGFNEDDLNIYVQNGTLHIKCKKDHHWGNWGHKEYALTLTIPKGHSFRKAEIEMGVGHAQVYDLHADELDISAGAGEVLMENIFAREMDVDGGIGSIHVQGEVHDLDYEGGVGEFIFEGIGDPDDYRYEVENGVGSVQINGADYSGLGNDIKFGSGSRKICIDSGVGSVTIEIGR